jgi:outer membrane cobalamin receptor
MAGIWIKCVSIISVFIVGIVFGDKAVKDTVTQDLTKMVVTATKQSRSIKDIPVSATVIDKQQIEHSAAKNIDDLLQYVAGVQVKRPVGMGEGVPSDIMMRGIPGALTASRVLILVDGIPTNLSGTPFLILNEIPLDAVQKVEVIRGPFSSLYGANAFGGVINIITEMGDGSPKLKLTGETSFPLTAAHNYGVDGRQTGMKFWKESAELAYWNISGVAGGGNECFDILAAGGARTVGHYNLSDSTFIRKGDTTFYMSGANRDYTDYRLLIRSGVRLNDKTILNVHLRYFNNDLGYGKTETDPDEDIIIRGNKFLAGTYFDISVFENLHLKVGGFGRTVDGDYFERADSGADRKNVSTKWDALSQDVQGELSAVYTPFDKISIIAGTDLLWSKIAFGALKFRSTGMARPGEVDIVERFRNIGIYTQTDIELHHFNVVPALRVDYHSEFGWMFSPKIGVSSRVFDHLTLRASYGNAFRAPSTVELYGAIVIGKNKIRGNSDLLAEQVQSIDCGFETDLFKGVTIQSNYFHNVMKNLITISIGAEALNGIVSYENLDDAWSYGLENEITWSPTEPLTCMVNYTLTESQNIRYKKPLDYIPRHKFNASVMYNRVLGSGSLHISVNEGYVGTRHYADWNSSPTIRSKRTPDGKIMITFIPKFMKLNQYFRTDLSCSYTLKNDHEITFNAQNLFNAQIEQMGGTLLPGRVASIKYIVPVNF